VKYQTIANEASKLKFDGFCFQPPHVTVMDRSKIKASIDMSAGDADITTYTLGYLADMVSCFRLTFFVLI